ncbi:LANO_0E00210g1_1 [Lachancea nothofagi CBS 11611]|uniref:LANO_0E00210g1_1 n=1 Tax=Lachancea nothofagi CBS 11611 TaxID=1266666 RepID=A0A1G4JP20_9SACH|nr:LANO_0E00210g1_1 [Lachancea nothofagi CBS 11611]
MRIRSISALVAGSITLWFQVAQGKDLGAVFNSLSISPEQNTNNLPQGLWDASVGLTITDSMNAQPGDTFTLDIPDVYKVYGASGTDSFTISSAGSELAQCSVFSGMSLTTDSRVTCTITNQNINQMASAGDVSGSVTLPFIFSVGGSAYQADLDAASAFEPGTQTVTWNEMPATVSFAAGPTYTPSLADGYDSATDPTYYLRTSMNSEIQTYFVGSQCSGGSVAHEMIQITYAGASRNDAQTGQLVSCSDVQIMISNDFNSWMMPQNAQPAPSSVSYTCQDNTVTIDAKSVPAGYRVFVAGNQKPSTSGNPITLTNQYQDNVTCSDGSTQNKTFSIRTQLQLAAASGVYQPFVISTSTYAGDATTITTTVVDGTQNYIILKPTPRTTVTKTYDGTAVTTRTLSHESDATFITVEVDLPTRTKTTTVPWTGTVPTTYLVTTGSTFTQVVQTPAARTTITNIWTTRSHSTTTDSFNPSSDSVVTVEIWEPSSTTTTQTTYYTGTSESFTTLPYSDSDVTVSVLDYKPYPRSTTFIPTTGTTLYNTSALTNSAGQTTGLQIIKIAPVQTVTTTYVWSSSYTSSSTVPTQSGASVVTVVLDIPPYTQSKNAKCGPTNGVTGLECSSGLFCNGAKKTCQQISTVTQSYFYGGATPSTTTLPYVTSDTTVVIYQPPSTTTRTVTWNQVFTSTLTEEHATDASLVYVDVEIPVTTTVRSTWSQTAFSTMTEPVADDSTEYTVVIYGPPVSETTSTSSYTGRSATTYTISNNPTQVTIIDLEPIPRTTVTRGWTYSTTGTTEFNCGDIEEANPTLNIFHKRGINPYTQACDVMNTVTTQITEVVHVPFVTSTVNFPYTGSTTSSSISLSDGALTETIANYVPNTVCKPTASACGSLTTSGSSVFGVQTACCQLGLRCATDSSSVICVAASTSTTSVTKYWTQTSTFSTVYTTFINGLPYVETEYSIPIVTSTLTRTGSYKSTSTVSTISGNSNLGTATVIVQVPSATPKTVTITNGWASSYTSTVSTLTPSDTTSGTFTIVVETPTANVNSTTTTGWTGSFTSTYSTALTTFTGSDGIPTTETVYYVETPVANTNSTTTTGWTGSFTSTYSTALTTFTGSDGIPTTETVYYVETPVANVNSTTTTGWTGSFTSTYSTALSTFTGSDSIPTTDTIYYVETPTANANSTVYTPWTGSFTSTYSTELTTFTGSDGVPTTETVYYVETPTGGANSTVYTPWTGSFTSTYSTDVTTFSGSDGIPTTETIYYVETPVVGVNSTTTTGWSGSFTSTFSTD